MTTEILHNDVVVKRTSARRRRLHVRAINVPLDIYVRERPATVGRQRGYAEVYGRDAYGVPLDENVYYRRDLGRGWRLDRPDEL